MDNEYWQRKWVSEDIAFHRRVVTPCLMRHWTGKPGAGVFVPLCGKSLDMDWLANRGHRVVGVELSELACRAFFEETARPFSIVERADGFRVFSDATVELWCGDFFALPDEALSHVSCIYDRAALVALPPELRTRYVAKLKQLLSDPRIQRRLFLVTTEYDDESVLGPPFNITETMVRAFFSEVADVHLLERATDELLSGHPKLKRTTVRECAYSLVQTSSSAS